MITTVGFITLLINRRRDGFLPLMWISERDVLLPTCVSRNLINSWRFIQPQKD